MIIFFGSKNLHTLVQDNIDSFMKMFLYLYKRNIIIANFFSTLLSAVLIISISNIAIKYSKPIAENKLMIVGFTILLLFIILTKHIKPFVQEIKSLNLTSKGNKNEK